MFYCRNACYRPVLDVERYLVPAKVHLPPRNGKLSDLLEVAKECLNNNFFSCFATVAGSLLLFHYEYIQEKHSCCPLVLCYSTSCGTGTCMHT